MASSSSPQDDSAYCNTETRAPPPANEDAPEQRQIWSSEGYPLPPIAHKPSCGPVEPGPTEKGPGAKPYSHYFTQLYTLSYLVFFAILGTLARLGLQALTFYPGAPVATGVLWANVGGSLLMGFFLEDMNLFREEWGNKSTNTNTKNTNNGNGNSNTNTTTNNNNNNEPRETRSKHHKAIKKTIPLYIGLTTGFCGSFTSFSSFIRDIFLALSNDLPKPSTPSSTPNGGYSFMALVAVLLTTVSLSLSALIFGAHLALACDSFTFMPAFPFRFTRRCLDPLCVVLAWGCWLGAVFLAIWPPDRKDAEPETWRGRAVFAIVFAPLGCLFRYYLSLFLNTRLPAFPMGTFVANIFGTIILSICYDLQRVDGLGSSSSPVSSSLSSLRTSCQVLQGVMDGFCGAATTVSTWVAELNGLGKRRQAYFYGIVSVGVALGFVVVIVGSLRWTVGFGTPVCG